MRTTLIIFLCLTVIEFKTFAGFGGEARFSGDQPPDEMAAQGLRDAMAAYSNLEAQQRQLAEQDALLQLQKQADEIARRQAIQDRLQELKEEASQKTQEAEAAELSVQDITKKILQQKRQIPVDPWREIDGVQEFVKSPNTGFVKFIGQILQTTTNGILVDGSCGTKVTKFFVEHFPLESRNLSDGDYFQDGDKSYVAIPDGSFTYIAIDGSIRSIPKLDYGKPCFRPSNANAIETKAQQLTPQEAQQISDAKNDAQSKLTDAQTAASTLQAFIKEIEDEKKAELAAKNAPQAKALEFDQQQANNGDTYGLLRMGERYMNGEGVTKDLSKARLYLTKAADGGSLTAAQELKNLNQYSNLGSTSDSK
jgi:hypothetical protein